MNHIRFNPAHLTIAEFLFQGRRILTSLTNNPYVTAPNPPLPTLQGLIDAASAKVQAHELAKHELNAMRMDRDAALQALAEALRAEAACVEGATGGDEFKLLTTGFEIAATRSASQLPAQVSSLKLTPGWATGTVNARWRSVRGVRIYEIQSNSEPNATTGWVSHSPVSKAKAMICGLTSGMKIWVRVRAVGAAGPGPWSMPAAQMVP